MEIDSIRTSPEPAEMPQELPANYPPRDERDIFREECCIETCTEEGQEESLWGRLCALVACVLCPICRLIDAMAVYFFGEQVLDDSAGKELPLQMHPPLETDFFNPFIATQYQNHIDTFFKDVETGVHFPCELEMIIRVYPDCRIPDFYQFAVKRAYGENEKAQFKKDFQAHLDNLASQLYLHNIALDFRTKIGILIHAEKKGDCGKLDCFTADASITALSSSNGSDFLDGLSSQKSRDLRHHHLKQLNVTSEPSPEDLIQISTLQEQLQAARS